MGIEQNKDGAYLPDKNTKWPEMATQERDKVYSSLKETYGGRLAKLDAKTELAKKRLEDKVKADLGMEVDDFWAELSGSDFRTEFKASDPRLKGMPVSQAILLTFKEQTIPGNAEKIGIKGKERELMLFCLNYLQNAPENKAKNPNGNIDYVPRNGTVKIINDEDDTRWRLRIEDVTGTKLFEGYLFPIDL
ncbi:MAG: hypothetical protein WC897_04160 [Candidatus Gracilibacteria bacterium]